MDPNNLNDQKPQKVAFDSTESLIINSDPQLEPVVQVIHHKSDRHVPTVVGYILAAFLVAAIVVWFGRWLYDRSTNTNNPKPPVSGNTAKVPAQPGTSSSTTPTPATSSANTGSATKPSTNTSTQLPNSGPGNVVALFIGTSLIFGGLHYLYGLRRSLS